METTITATCDECDEEFAEESVTYNDEWGGDMCSDCWDIWREEK